MTYYLRRACTSADTATVARMWVDAAAWLASVGSDQWQYPPRTGRIAASVAAGTCWIVDHDGTPAATITLDGHADPEFWSPADEPESALYVHRLIAPGRTGLGTSLLDWAGGQAEAAGRVLVRADAWKTNAALGRWYVAQRFQHVRTVDLPHRGSGALYQRPAEVRVGTGPALHSAP